MWTWVSAFLISASAALAAPIDVPLQIVRGVHPVAMVSVNGAKPQPMLLDTGVTRSILPERGRNIVSLCFAKDLCFGPLAVHLEDTPYTRTPDNGSYQGLIGMDVLGQMPVMFDYHRAVVTFDATKPASATTLPFELHQRSRRPYAPLSAAQVPLGPHLLDTGSSYTRLTQAQFDQLADGDTQLLWRERAFGARKTEETEIYRIPEICLSGPPQVCQRDAIVQKGRWAALGSTFFRDFRTGFDTGNREIWLIPQAKALPLNSVLTLWGVQIDLNSGNEIAKVLPTHTVLRPGDRILAINGKPVDGYLHLHRILEDPALKTVTLTIEREGHTLRRVLSRD